MSDSSTDVSFCGTHTDSDEDYVIMTTNCTVYIFESSSESTEKLAEASHVPGP